MPLIQPLQPNTPLTPATDAQWAITLSATTLSGDMLLPVDMLRVARVHGVDVFQHPLGSDLSGYLKWDDKGAFIVVNGDDRSEYGFTPLQRFTIAHQLGHYYYSHRLGLPKTSKDLDSPCTDVEKDYADRFATTLLMPKSAVCEKFGVTSDVETLARIFNVSQEAMGTRLYNLGISA